MAFLFKSIRWRLIAWLAFLLAVILTGFGVTAYQLYRVNQLNQIDEGLARRITLLTSEIRGPKPPSGRGGVPDEPPHDFERRGPPPSYSSRSDGGPGPHGSHLDNSPPDLPSGRGGGGVGGGGTPRPVRLSDATAALFDEPDTAAPFYYWHWYRDGTVLTASANAPSDTPRPVRVGTDSGTHTRTRAEHRESYHFTELGDCVLAGVSLAVYRADTRRFAWWLVGAGGAVLALGLGGGWVIATRAIRPVETISAAAGRISEGNLAERINVTDTDSELGQLASVLNSTFARLARAFAEQKNFSADASHELRTPLAVIITEAQTTLARVRDAADYRAALEACLDTAQQMRRLTDSLLEFARFDAGQETMERAPFDLAETVQTCIALIRPLAAAREIAVQTDLAPAPFTGDADRLARVVINLLHNAVHYNVERGEIRVVVRAEKNGVVLKVTNSGPGIAPEDLPHIFARFYRADKVRSRSDGRSGLGLAICQTIVQAHRGEIAVESRLGAGATFTVRLPAP